MSVYSLMAVTLTETLYPTRFMRWGKQDFTTKLKDAVTFNTPEQAMEYALNECHLYDLGAFYDWYVIEYATERLIAQFIQAPKRFGRMGSLYLWLNNLLPYEELIQIVDGEVRGVVVEAHPEIHRLEITHKAGISTVAELKAELRKYPSDWGLFDLHPDSGEEWTLSVTPYRSRCWELSSYVSSTYLGFVYLKDFAKVEK